ncbi:hypothetical protein O1611_g2514 [Lasiodiplodia mahajangana]|uniref:Uncharacterized protein n=1 Tax=Lasiodiplodia mahajangana TaxID=1108764 RepID=A0ACC2JV22_9PEZI|nr:hypothetical protein O1611_g2514 [Lasiodiplodia mahajangana]
MYDWPECRADIDEQWVALRDRLRAAGVDAPDRLVRRNADMPSVPGGIRCWGPMELGLAPHVKIVGQQDYSAVQGGKGELYSSAIVVPRPVADYVPAPCDGKPNLPLERLRGKRFVYNSPDSMSGILGLERDLASLNEHLRIFSKRLESGGHRHSIIAVAEGKADVAAIDCFTWDLAKRFESTVGALTVVGWTGRRQGLPFIASRHIPLEIVELLVLELKNSAPT